MDTSGRAGPAHPYPVHHGRAAAACRWLLLAGGLFSSVGAAAHPYGPFGLPIFLPPPPPAAFRHATPDFVPERAPTRPAPAPRAAPPARPASAAPPPAAKRTAATDSAQCRHGPNQRGCMGGNAGPLAAQFHPTGPRP
ncbi:hypothetical protein [Massilia sp. METH4]|uniref:hypothetical protein n=1 Tax=Massilia sp. METH4 TaxID=3123041 RepID=UPI0030D5BA4B